MRLFNTLLCILFILLASSVDIDAQVRRKSSSSKAKSKKSKTEEKISIIDKINPEIKFGNLGFFNGLSVSSKIDAGYKLHPRFTVGGGAKLFYDQYAVLGPDPSVFDYGGLVMARGKITQEIYIQAEYAFMHYSKDPDPYQIRGLFEDRNVNYPLIGAGYMSGIGKWRFGIELMYIGNQEAQDIQNSVIEYWFGASYNF